MANNKRIVTGNDAAGHSRVIREEIQPGMESWTHMPGFSAPVVWHTDQTVTIGSIAPSFSPPVSVVPGPGGTCSMLVTFPPAAPTSPDFDPAAMAAELSAKLPGLAECFEPDGSGFERTDTVDYGVVLEGEIWLELDDGSLTHLCAGDLIVQTAPAMLGATVAACLPACSSYWLAHAGFDCEPAHDPIGGRVRIKPTSPVRLRCRA